jgi:hypothetical protein
MQLQEQRQLFVLWCFIGLYGVFEQKLQHLWVKI